LNELRAKVTAFGCDLEFVSGRLEQAYDDRTNNLGGDEQLTESESTGRERPWVSHALKAEIKII